MEIEKLNLINEYLKEQLWMDFQVCSVNCGKIEVFGYLDEASEDMIKIIFIKPYMMLSAFMFTYEGGGKFISLVTGNEAREMNEKYSVIQGNYIFKISNTNIDNSMYIIAQGIDVVIVGKTLDN